MIPSYARLTRGQVLQIKQLDFVTASALSGSKPIKIALKHILPNCLPALIILMTMNLGAAIMIEAGLSYLGIGVVPPNSSWGYLINYGRAWLNTKPYMCIAPGVFIILTAWAFNICGDALRDALDPKLRGRL
jgi:peptide/nickel transport system permease protein